MTSPFRYIGNNESKDDTNMNVFPSHRLPPPSSYWDKLSYLDQWRAATTPCCVDNTTRTNNTSEYAATNNNNSYNNNNETVFGLSFLQSTTTDGFWLAGCTKSGEICIWHIVEATGSNDDEILRQQHMIHNSHPIWSQKVVTNGVLYNCQFVQCSNTNHWLIVCGDGGIRIFDWENHIVPTIRHRQQENDNDNSNQQLLTKEKRRSSTSSLADTVAPIYSFRTNQSPLEQNDIEINDFVVVDDGKYIYGVAGDSFVYKFDMQAQQHVTTYRQPQQSSNTNSLPGYLHSIAQVPSTSLLLMGGEDGILNVWDTSQDKLVDSLNMHNEITSSRVPSSSRASSSTAAASSSSYHTKGIGKCWISCCLARDENWWTIAGGTTNNGQSNGGFLATFHGPTRSLVSSVTTRETPNTLLLYSSSGDSTTTSSNSPSSSSFLDSLLSVSNENYITHWNEPLQLQQDDHETRRQRVWCTTPCGYAIASSSCSRGSGYVAVGGVGSIIDLYENRSQPYISLTTTKQ